MTDKKEIELYCDGACAGNPGPGGWGTILRFGAHERELSGGQAQTTNNRMELTALLEGLRALKEPCRVRVVTDSEYVANGINKGWARGWQRNGWRKSDKKPALNPDLWEALLQQLDRHQVTVQWVRGHNGHPENERCDQLATAQARHYKEKK
jgi:ribonuclease HI